MITEEHCELQNLNEDLPIMEEAMELEETKIEQDETIIEEPRIGQRKKSVIISNEVEEMNGMTTTDIDMSMINIEKPEERNLFQEENVNVMSDNSDGMFPRERNNKRTTGAVIEKILKSRKTGKM